MSSQEAYRKMRRDLGLDSKSGYKDSGVGNGILGEVMRVVKRQIHFIIIPMKRVGEPPSDMFDSHAHHILFKKGRGRKQQELTQKAQQILAENYRIDPIKGKEVLCWAPNRVGGATYNRDITKFC